LVAYKFIESFFKAASTLRVKTMNSSTKQVSMDRLVITVLRQAHRVTIYWPFRRFYFPDHVSSWLYAKVSCRFFVAKDYAATEMLLFETLKLRPWNHRAWHQLGILFTKADQNSFEAEKCHLRVLWIAGAQQKEDKYTKSSRAFLLRLGIDPYQVRNCSKDYERDVHEIDDFLLNLPGDLPRLGDSRIPLAFLQEEERLSYYARSEAPQGYDLYNPNHANYLGNPSCINNARSAYLQCAVNPTGDCGDCKDFRDIVED
jgi:Family of unknown function (DUF6464)